MKAQQGLSALSRIDKGFVLVRGRRPGTAVSTQGFL